MASPFPFLAALKASGDLQHLISNLEQGNYKQVVQSEAARQLLPSLEDVRDTEDKAPALADALKKRITNLAQQQTAFVLGLALLQWFLQSNVTGPLLDFDSFPTCFPDAAGLDAQSQKEIQRALIRGLDVDGHSAYVLTPHIELLWLAKRLLDDERTDIAADAAAWARIRVNFWHQQLLSEPAETLQDDIYRDLVVLEGYVLGEFSSYSDAEKAVLLTERATIHTFYDADAKARADLAEASRLRQFQYVLTGRLGRRTKFQQFDMSQLVVLAKSGAGTSSQPDQNGDSRPAASTPDVPKNFDLEDDTLLEKISFSDPTTVDDVAAETLVPPALQGLDADPSKQPTIDPEDCAILLAFASSVTNTQPDHGLTREETLPYASRVYEAKSPNWEIYSQALLVRSRIECHKARTASRGLLQLQALVDQVISDTGGADGTSSGAGDASATTFLPRAKSSESAPAVERLRYVHLLAPPPRWALEGELAAQWASQGGLRTALDIYERLEMWAEASLCLAATDQEAKAVRMVRRQLFHPGPPASGPSEGEQFYGPELSQPVDAPRLLCILGDLEQDAAHFERAWSISGARYARAQRSLGKYYTAKGSLAEADAAYSLAVRASPQHAATWFALGCVRLQTSAWPGAVQAFQRTVQIENDDAEAWSNLAAALLNLPADEDAGALADEAEGAEKGDEQRHIRAAFAAFKRAAALKRDSYRIWANVLGAGLRVSPPPLADLLVAQRRIIELRGASEGEGCVDAPMLEAVLRHVAAEAAAGGAAAEGGDAAASGPAEPRRGIERMLADLVRTHVQPLITHSRRLWVLVARLELHLRRPGAALAAYEKAWRASTNRAGWDDGGGDGKAWAEVQDATEELADAYESLGEREAVEGLKGGTGELVCANWRFKARSAVRGVVGRRVKAGFDDVDRLRERMEALKE